MILNHRWLALCRPTSTPTPARLSIRTIASLLELWFFLLKKNLGRHVGEVLFDVVCIFGGLAQGRMDAVVLLQDCLILYLQRWLDVEYTRR